MTPREEEAKNQLWTALHDFARQYGDQIDSWNDDDAELYLTPATEGFFDQVVAPLLADAWDDGWRTGEGYLANPYRADAIGRGE